MSTNPDVTFPPLVEPGPDLTPEQRARYARHAILPGIGVTGQRRLLAANVLVMGAGGLGSPVLAYLAAAGVGRITVVDDDVVDESNLQRQVIHGVADVGRPKVESAADAIARIDPSIRVTTVRRRLDADNALDVLAGHDLVLDGTDNFATRYLVADACEILGIPCVWGAILRFDGQVSVFWPGRGPLYRDLFPQMPDPALVPSCAEAGVFGVLCGSVGAAMATEAVKLITGVGRPLVGRLLTYDALDARWRELNLRPDPQREPVTRLADSYEFACAAPASESASGPASGPDRLPSADELTVTAEQLIGLLEARVRGEADFELIDVREPGEYELVHIEGAHLVPKDEILTGRVELPRDRPLILHCAAGVRSAMVLEHLLRQGYPDVRHLEGGLHAWPS